MCALIPDSTAIVKTASAISTKLKRLPSSSLGDTCFCHCLSFFPLLSPAVLRCVPAATLSNSFFPSAQCDINIVRETDYMIKKNNITQVYIFFFLHTLLNPRREILTLPLVILHITHNPNLHLKNSTVKRKMFLSWNLKHILYQTLIKLSTFHICFIETHRDTWVKMAEWYMLKWTKCPLKLKV